MAPISAKADRVAIWRKRTRGFWIKVLMWDHSLYNLSDCFECVFEQGLVPDNSSEFNIVHVVGLYTNCCRVSQSVLDEFVKPMRGHEKHFTDGMACFIIEKEPLNTPSIVQESTCSWPNSLISFMTKSVTKDMFSSCLVPMCQRHGEYWHDHQLSWWNSGLVYCSCFFDKE